MGVFEEFVRILAWTKLSSQPNHTSIQKAENLEKRLQNLHSVSLQDFTNLMRKCGLKLNDRERDILFQCFDLDDQRSLDLAHFSNEVNCILSPRRRAIVRTLKSFPASSPGSIAIADLIRRAESLYPLRAGQAGNKLEDTLNMISEVRKRLQDSLKRGDQRQHAGHNNYRSDSNVAAPSSRVRSGSQELSSPESLSASDTYQGNPLEGAEVQIRSVKRRLVYFYQFLVII